MSAPERPAADLIEYRPGFLDSREASDLLHSLWRELRWSQPDIQLFGRTMKQPRLVAYCGDPAAVYAYSGTQLDPVPWHPVLADLRDRIEGATGFPFNAVLVNAYRDGRDSMGWHADNEKELGPQPAIASLSLGASRRFRLRSRHERSESPARSRAIVLESGSLLLMKPGCQEAFQHAVPRTRKPVGLRLNLTWRQVVLQPPD